MPFMASTTFDLSDWLKKLIRPSGDRTRKRVAAWFLVFIAYIVTAQIGIFLYRDLGTSPAIIWPPVGIALAAIILEGYWIWTAIFLAALCNGFLNSSPFFLVVFSTLANTAQPLIGGAILNRARFDVHLRMPRDMFVMASVALFTTTIVPTVNLCSVLFYNAFFDMSRPVPSWSSVWVGGALSALVLTPFLTRWITWLNATYVSPRNRYDWAEAGISVAALCGASVLLFASPFATVFGISTIILLIAVLFWIALRVGPRFMTLALFLMTAISLIGALYGVHPPSATNQTLSERLIDTEIFDLLLAFFFFILVSIEEQRKEAIKSLGHEANTLERALEKIRNEDKAKNEFIATLAHELRNPLAPLRSSIELLKLIGAATPEKEEIFGIMDKQIKMLTHLLDDLLDISRITARKLNLQKEHVEIQKLVTSAVETTRFFREKQKHTLTLTLPNEKIEIHADPIRVEQILINILNNAAKYTPPGGTIEIFLTQEKRMAVIKVRDSGVGLSPEMIPRIFEPFVQINPSGSKESGIGVGLFLTKNLVRLHGGNIQVMSGGLGKGSEFTVSLPLESPPTPIPETKSLSRRSVSPADILIVDDNIDAAESLKKLLEFRGHHVFTAYSGAEARVHAIRKPRVVLLDIELPDIDGYQLARELRRNDSHVILIAISGYGTEADKQKAREAGMNSHLTKPVSLQTVEDVLLNTLNRV